MSVILIRYGEIGIKRGTRHIFEAQLRRNIMAALSLPKDQVRLEQAQFVVSCDEEQVAGFIERLKLVFGISWFAPAQVCENQFDQICALATKMGLEKVRPDTSFGVRAKRSFKEPPFNSIDLQKTIGTAIGSQTGAKVNLSSPDIQINVHVTRQGTYIFLERYEGAKGLPVGSSGKVLSLLSGGFDSIASSYLLAKRGAQVDYLHFHIFMDKKYVLNTKISQIVDGLFLPTASKKLYVCSYSPFEMKVLNLNSRSQRYETVLFRRLMARVAQELAWRKGYKALIMGDSLGQVASQTMENLVAVDDAVDIPIFRPLIGYDKFEVVNLVEKIGLFAAATAEYKDCCSILSPDPVKQADLNMIYELEGKLNINGLVEEMVNSIEEIQFGEMVSPPDATNS